jgi:malate dehydrogenase (oxaloacetate-decarboxylating)
LQISHVALQNVRVIIFGAGTAGIGIADQITDQIANQTGKSVEEASQQLWYVHTKKETSHINILCHIGVLINQAFLLHPSGIR